MLRMEAKASSNNKHDDQETRQMKQKVCYQCKVCTRVFNDYYTHFYCGECRDPILEFYTEKSTENFSLFCQLRRRSNRMMAEEKARHLAAISEQNGRHNAAILEEHHRHEENMEHIKHIKENKEHITCYGNFSIDDRSTDIAEKKEEARHKAVISEQNDGHYAAIVEEHDQHQENIERIKENIEHIKNGHNIKCFFGHTLNSNSNSDSDRD